jgi:hypothetical protein
MGGRLALLTGLVGALAVAGCAGDAARYPSLALREAERRTFVAPAPAPAETPAAPRTAALTQISALEQSAESAFAAFAAKRPGAAALVARARRDGPGTPAHSAALVALGDLSAQRSATFVPLGELDRLAAATSAEYGDTAAITAAQNAVLALVEQQDAALGALWGELGQ